MNISTPHPAIIIIKINAFLYGILLLIEVIEVSFHALVLSFSQQLTEVEL